MTQYFPSKIRHIFDPEKGLVQEIGDPSTVTFASGTIIEVSGVFAYVPEDPSQWAAVPTNLIQAVDYLAAGSGSGGGGGGGGTPGGSNGDIQYKVNATTFGGVNKLTFVGGNLVGTGSFNGVFSGSLTKLTDGTSYIKAGSNITVTTASNGSITIASTGGGGTISGSIAANQIAYGTAANTISGSGAFTFDGSTLALNTSAPSALTIASSIDGQFLEVNSSLYSISLTDPLNPTNNLTLGPSDVGLGDGSVSANMYAGEVSVTDNGTTNSIGLSVPGGEATLKADDGSGSLIELHLSASSLTMQSSVASGDFLTIDSNTQRLTVVDPGTGIDLVYLEGGRATIDAAGNTLSFDAFTVPTITTLNVGSSLPMPLNLSIEALQINSDPGTAGYVLTSSGPGVPPGWASTVSNAVSSSYADFALSASYATNAEFSWEQTKFVAKNGNDATADGTLNKPFLTISGAMASINDASPSKRYIINVNPGAYTETGIFELKANVFINGFDRNTVRITPTSFALNSDFSGSSAIDNRSGFSNCTLIGDCNFDWSAVFSPAGKLYFQNCSFNNNVTLTGYNNSIAQTVTSNCLFFGSYTISGINAGTHQGNIHYGAVNLNQHPSLPTILNANGGGAGSTTVTTTVNNFGRRCACFFYSFWAGSLTIDGPSSYVDATQSSLDTAGPTLLNGGTFVPIGSVANRTLSNLTNPTSINANLVPDTTNNRYNGDFGKQWLFNFAYVYGSTGTEMYFITMPNTFGSSDTGRDIWLLPDGYGLDTNVNGGNIILETAATSGTGSRGAIILNARHVDVSGSLIRNLATPITGSDAATAKYADVFPTGSTGSRPTGPVTGQRFFDITIGLPIWWNGTNWINAAGTIV